VNEETLTLLLSGGHVDAGVPGATLRMRDLAKHIARLVKQQGFFPRPWVEHREGEPVDERGVIERRGLFYVYRSQRHYAWDNRTVAERGARWFLSPVRAAMHYLRWDLNLPGNLDGWKVE
jgi:hypothetical protein